MAEIIVISRTVSNIILPNDGNPMTILNGGVANSTTVNRMGCLHVSNGGAFDGTTFTLFIDDGAGVELTLNQTISGGEFDGYTLKYDDGKLTFGKLAAL